MKLWLFTVIIVSNCLIIFFFYLHPPEFGLTSCDRYQYHYVNLKMSWFDAQRYCRLKYTDLANFHSSEDVATAKTATEDETFGPYVWIGLNDHPSARKEVIATELNSWRWSGTNIRYTFVNWKTGEPNFQGANESCVRTFPDGQWEDSHCDLQSPFICFDGKKQFPFFFFKEYHSSY
uniref:C-type lectin domain-containing protein n=1 Tax=Salarias fasciatus TaxID=181472 RepID=A0A672FAU8_SALFA